MLMMILIVWILNVAPLVGAWIEILSDITGFCKCNVAPLVGAWIEIVDTSLP